MGHCLRVAWAHPQTSLGMAAVVISQMIMTSVMVMTPLHMLGLGWSCTLIAGSALVAQSTEPELKMPMQGTVDTFMNVDAAAITAVSGGVLAWHGFVGINVMAVGIWLVLLLIWTRR